jgi:hypothetical protein
VDSNLTELKLTNTIMKAKIIELFRKYEGAVDRSNYPEMAICEDNYNELADEIVKLLAAPAVSESVEPVGEGTVCDCHRPFATKMPDGELLCDYCKKTKKKQTGR